MPDIQWNSQASLIRVTTFATTDAQEELMARGTLRELMGNVLEMPAAAQTGLLLRAAGPDWTREFDTDALRELAARPDYTSAPGAYDTAGLADDPDRAEEHDAPFIDGGVSAPVATNALGRDGEK